MALSSRELQIIVVESAVSLCMKADMDLWTEEIKPLIRSGLKERIHNIDHF